MNSPDYRVGEGWDRHRLEEHRILRLAGVEIEADRGTMGHSDADVALHAVMDALLGALGEADIGVHFPPGDPEWEDADSLRMLDRVGGLLRSRGWSLVNLDLTIILEGIRLAPHREEMARKLQATLPGKPPVNVKFSTAEGVGPVGREEAVDARAVVLLCRTKDGSPSGSTDSVDESPEG